MATQTESPSLDAARLNCTGCVGGIALPRSQDSEEDSELPSYTESSGSLPDCSTAVDQKWADGNEGRASGQGRSGSSDDSKEEPASESGESASDSNEEQASEQGQSDSDSKEVRA